MTRQCLRTAGALAAGAALGALAALQLSGQHQRAVAQAAAAAPADEALHATLEEIKARLPDQSHAMKDVGYHFANLWFAAQQKNWPLATFYNQETLSHLHWAVRIIPKRKDSLGQDVDLVAILQAFENSPWKQVKEAIDAQDSAAFEKAYRFTLETCYSCHKAAEKPYLRPQIPTAPEAPIINFDPAAKWPP
jgi:hypothetical protein